MEKREQIIKKKSEEQRIGFKFCYIRDQKQEEKPLSATELLNFLGVDIE